jgi:hypothetical protein
MRATWYANAILLDLIILFIRDEHDIAVEKVVSLALSNTFV